MHFWSHCKGFILQKTCLLHVYVQQLIGFNFLENQYVIIIVLSIHPNLQKLMSMFESVLLKWYMLLVVWLDNIIVAHESILVSTHWILQILYLIKKCSFLQSIAACNFCIRCKFGSLPFISNWCLLCNL